MSFDSTIGAAAMLPLLIGLGSNSDAPAAGLAPSGAPAGVPVTFSLQTATRATVVLDDTDGHRVANLTSDTAYTAGRHTLLWNGLRPDGTPASPGTYRVRALLHQPITLRYQLSVNSPGSPPWPTLDHTGAWLNDHTPPCAALFLPAGSGAPYGDGQPLLMLGGSTGESSDSLIWLSLDGRKLHGGSTNGWAGAIALGRDMGPHANPDFYAYSLIHDDGLALYGLLKSGGARKIVRLGDMPPFRQGRYAVAVSAYNGLVACSLGDLNQVALVDSATGQVRARAPVTAPVGLVFQPDGQLLVTRGPSIIRCSLTPAGDGLTAASKVVDSGLEAPRMLALDGQGNIYAGDWGQSHQVKLFDKSGRLLRVLGHAGGPRMGWYDEQRMFHPNGIAVTPDGTVWVAEDDYQPKRVSVWGHNGQFVRAYYGSPRYGAGGMLDPHDPTRFYYEGVEFALDWKTGTSKPRTVYWRNVYRWDDGPPVDADFVTDTPDWPIYLNGHQYMVAEFNGFGRLPNGAAMIWEMESDGIAYPVAAVAGGQWADGTPQSNGRWGDILGRPDIQGCKPDADNDCELQFAWSDLNGDHKMEANEIQFVKIAKARECNEFFFIRPDLSLTSNWGWHLDAPSIDANGIPNYDITKASYLLPGKTVRSLLMIPLGDGHLLDFGEGEHGFTYGQGLSGFTGTAKVWNYPWTGAQDGSGSMVKTSRILGLPVRVAQDVPLQVLFVYGDEGSVYLVTSDGYFLTTLGGDAARLPLWRMTHWQPGMTIEGVSFGQEHFHPTVTQTEDGRVMLVAGKEHSSLLQVEGLDSLRHVELGTVTLSESVPPPSASPSQLNSNGPVSVAIPLLPGTHPKGSALGDWPAGAPWLALGDGMSASLVVQDGQLRARYRTGDPALLTNGAEDPRYLFVKGGGLDLMLAPPHGLRTVATTERLLVGKIKGRIVGMLYRENVKGVTPDQRVLFESPIGQVWFDRVDDVTANLQFAEDGAGNYELTAPLALLGLTAASGGSVLGDIGVLRGDGDQTLERLYWSDKNANNISDVPSEARLVPADWGVWEWK